MPPDQGSTLRNRLSAAEWLVTESGFEPGAANRFETLFTVGNGYLGTRGTFEEGHRGELSGTYLCGVYDSHDAAVIDLVNAPDWLSFAVTVAGVRIDVQTCAVVSHERALDVRHGVLWRRTVFCDAAGRRTRLESMRMASMADRHLCALRGRGHAGESRRHHRRRERDQRPPPEPGPAARV